MLVTARCESGSDQGKWYMMRQEPAGAWHKVGYCALGCAGHGSREDAREHYLEHQLDRVSTLSLERGTELECEICSEPTTLRARLGDERLFVLCRRHQSTAKLKQAFLRRSVPEADSDA